MNYKNLTEVFFLCVRCQEFFFHTFTQVDVIYLDFDFENQITPLDIEWKLRDWKSAWLYRRLALLSRSEKVLMLNASLLQEVYLCKFGFASAILFFVLQSKKNSFYPKFAWRLTRMQGFLSCVSLMWPLL